MTPESLKVREYRRTPKGLLTLIFANQKMTSKKMERSPPSYTKKELGDWLFSRSNFQTLFKNWVASGFDKNLSPSIDRIKNNLGYDFSNIRLVSWEQNHQNQKINQKQGIDSTWNMRSVDQLDLDGKHIKTFHSVQEAMRQLGKNPKAATNIANICNGKWETSYGYKWRWT